MSLLSISRPAALLVAAAFSLLGVACSGDSGRPAYAPTDVELNATSTLAATPGCQAGDTRACTIYLGQHGDVSNCIQGLDVCYAGEWTGCIDEASLAENPELVSQLVAE